MEKRLNMYEIATIKNGDYTAFRFVVAYSEDEAIEIFYSKHPIDIYGEIDRDVYPKLRFTNLLHK